MSTDLGSVSVFLLKVEVFRSFQIQFSGIVKDGQYSDIALDDIRITAGYCPIGGKIHYQSNWLPHEFQDVHF